MKRAVNSQEMSYLCNVDAICSMPTENCQNIVSEKNVTTLFIQRVIMEALKITYESRIEN